MPDLETRLIDRLLRRYSFAWSGNLHLDSVQLDYDPADRISFSAEQQQDIEQTWRRMMAQGFKLHDAPLYRMKAIDGSGTGLRFTLGHTGYREYMGTNIARPDWARNAAHLMADPVAVSFVAVTSDGYVTLHRRSAQTVEYHDHWHVTPSGHVHPPDGLKAAALRELEEELDVSSDEVIGAPRVCGVVVNAEFHKPDALMFGRIQPSYRELLERQPQDAWEYEQLEPLKWSAEPVKDWLLEHIDDSVPQGHAAILSAAAADFGDPWFRDLLPSLHLPWLDA